MRKTDKKIDNQLRAALTQVCETALEEIDGFVWLTHLVNYANFPASLKIICVFDSNENLAHFMQKENEKALSMPIKQKLDGIGVKVKDITNHLTYDTEQNCESQHNGNWQQRLS